MVNPQRAAFQHIEEEFLSLQDLVSEWDALYQEWIEGTNDPSKFRRPLLVYIRRMSWIERIIGVFNGLYFKVNDEARMFMRSKYLEGSSFEEASQETGFSVKELRKIHKLIIWTSIEELGMASNLDSEKIQTEMSRYIPVKVRLEVAERDGNVCVRCGAEKELHFHHVERYAEGGSHDAENLIILCVSCHAEEHKGEKAYHLLKKGAGGYDVSN